MSSSFKKTQEAFSVIFFNRTLKTIERTVLNHILKIIFIRKSHKVKVKAEETVDIISEEDKKSESEPYSFPII